MDLQEYFNYENYIIPVDEVMGLTVSMLDDMYTNGDTYKQFNIFFILLHEYYFLKAQEKYYNEELSHISYLLSYYLFVLLTPPASEELALVYANEAYKYSNTNENKEWIAYVKKGN